ncbi:MAG TPA: GlsB/YeaQ/YmgE family stress response membrane protein [Thermoanaerobaculia bacterium]
MGILSWIIFGLIAGAIAKFLTPGRDPQGCIITMVIGIVGALLGGWIATLFHFGGISGFDFRSMVIAVIGAILLLLLWRVFTGRR